MDFADLFNGIFEQTGPEIMVFFAALAGAGVTSIFGFLGTLVLARTTMRSARLQAETTLKSVHEEVERRFQARIQRLRQELRERVERVSSQIVRPCERLLSRLIPMCKLRRVRCRDFNPAPTQSLSESDAQQLREYDRIAEMYERRLDLNVSHPGANQRATFIIHFFRTLAALGRWRQQIIGVVALDDPLVKPAIYQIRRIEVALCSPRLPADPWLSRDLVEAIEDTLRSDACLRSWERVAAKVAGSQQLQYAASSIDEALFGMFDPTLPFMKIRARQARAGILAIYLIDLLGLLLPGYEFPFQKDREEIWQAAVRDFCHQQLDRRQQILWYLYQEGDVVEAHTCPELPEPKQVVTDAR